MYNNLNQDNSKISPKTLKSFKVLRALKALRPLRIISKNQGLKLAVGSLFGALPAIANGMIVCLLVVFIYAIAGVNLFKGKFYSCLIPDQDEFEEIEHTIITK
jgi:voltage-gated cation channel